MVAAKGRVNSLSGFPVTDPEARRAVSHPHILQLPQCALRRRAIASKCSCLSVVLAWPSALHHLFQRADHIWRVVPVVRGVSHSLAACFASVSTNV